MPQSRRRMPELQLAFSRGVQVAHAQAEWLV
jgi:hypothetical protein